MAILIMRFLIIIFAITENNDYKLPFLRIFSIIDSLIVIRNGNYNRLVKALLEVNGYCNRFVIIIIIV